MPVICFRYWYTLMEIGFEFVYRVFFYTLQFFRNCVIFEGTMAFRTLFLRISPQEGKCAQSYFATLFCGNYRFSTLTFLFTQSITAKTAKPKYETFLKLVYRQSDILLS